MISKIEERLDKEFEKLGVKVRVFHYTKKVLPFRAVTIATADDKRNREEIYDIMMGEVFSLFEPSRIMIRRLESREIYGYAICSRDDQFNKLYGRNKAKGRLLQHLKKINGKKPI